MKIIIAGGTGFLGSALTRTLIEHKHDVALLVRSGSRRKTNQSENIFRIPIDFTQMPESLPIKPDALINCVGIIREFPSKGITFEKIHHDIAKFLVELAEKNDVGRFIQISALGTGPAGKTGYFKTKYKAEEILKNSGLNFTIFRPSVIYGPGDEFINMIAGIVKKFPIMPVIGNGRYRLQPVHIDDLCEAIALSLADDFTHNKTFEIGGPEVLTFNEIVDLTGRTLGKKAIKFHQPVLIMRLFAALFDRFPWFPVTRDQISMLFDENRTEDSRLFDRYNIIPKQLGDGMKEYL